MGKEWRGKVTDVAAATYACESTEKQGARGMWFSICFLAEPFSKPRNADGSVCQEIEIEKSHLSLKMRRSQLSGSIFSGACKYVRSLTHFTRARKKRAPQKKKKKKKKKK